jgi:CubicO group peptidase (beta-lactamase class C family)
MRKSLVLLFFFSFIVLHTEAQKISTTFIDSVVYKSMEMMPQAGLSVLVIEDGEVVHAKGYGLQSVNSKEKVNENTRFAIASNTKAFTTTALGILVDRGKLKWTDKVVDIIPQFKMYSPYVTANFNIEDLITHRSGLGLGAGDLMFFPDGSDFTIDDVLKSFQYQTPTSAFRTKYDYDNLLYIVAGEVIHRISGLQWGEFIESQILQPLGMDQTASFYQNLKSDKNIAKPHKVEGAELVEIPSFSKNGGSIGAAGAIYSNVTDMAKWLSLHLHNGKYGDSLEFELISAKTHRHLWKAHTNISYNATPRGPYKTHYSAYGLGFKLYDQVGHTIVQHSGGLPGMLSMVTMIPELNAGIIVLTNTAPGGYSFMTITNEIKDEFLGVESIDWLSRGKFYLDRGNAHADSVLNAAWQTVEEAKNVQPEKSNFVGSYKDDWFGKIVIEERDGQLRFNSLRSPKLSGPMFFYKANTYAVKWDYRDMECDAFIKFTLDKNGKAQSIRIEGISPNIDFSFDFQDLELERIQD